jgi:membrane protease subunit (stomatin/prohibitin family)
MLKYEAYHFGEGDLFSNYYPINLNYQVHLYRSFKFIFVKDGNIDFSANNGTFNLKKNNHAILDLLFSFMCLKHF